MRLASRLAGRGPAIPERWRSPLAVGLAAIGVGSLVIHVVSIWPVSSGWGYDFGAYYDAANRLAATGSPYQEQTMSGPYRPGPGGLYLYSPLLALLLVPLAALPIDVATFLWLAFRIVLLTGACALMPVSRNIRLATFGLVAVTPPVLDDLNLGNVSVIVTFLAVVVWRYLDRPAAGVALALSALLRPTSAVVGLWWILRRRLRPVAWAGVTLGVIGLASLPFVGVRGWFDYVSVLRNVSDVTGVYRNSDVASLVLRLGAPPWVASAVLVGVFAIAAGAVLLSLRRDRELSYVVTIGATLLLSPLLWDHYMIHLMIPAAFLASRGRWWGLALPVLTWLPQDLLGFLAIAATLLPFTARGSGDQALSPWVQGPQQPAQEPRVARALSEAGQ